MAHFGDTDPLLGHSDDNNDEDDGDSTRPFQPYCNSTPGPSGEQLEMRTMYTEFREDGAKMVQTSFMEGINLKTLRNSIKIAHAKDELRNQFSNMKESGIQFSFNEDKRVVMAKDVGQREEPVKIFKRKGTALLASFIKRFKPILDSERQGDPLKRMRGLFVMRAKTKRPRRA